MTGASPVPPPGLWCVIPVHNHAATVGAVARACRAQVPRVLVVDDGSTDTDVARLLRDTDITVLRHPQRQGKGQALVTALNHVSAHGGRWMLTLDADGQHLPEDIPRFFPLLSGAPNALVIGARDMQVENVPSSSRFGRSFSNFWVRLETGLPLDDTQSGFRAYPVELVRQLPLTRHHFDFEIEVLVRAAWAGLLIQSVPVRVWYPPPSERVTHFDKRLDNLRLSRLHARLVFRRLWPVSPRRLVRPATTVSLWRQPRAFLSSLLKTNMSPSGLAVSAGLGVLLGSLPVFGFHSPLILAAALRLHLNLAMALASQNLCTPPLVPVLCIQIGHYLLHGSWLSDFTYQSWVVEAGPRFLEWWLGSLLLGPPLAVLTGLLAFPVLSAFRRRTA